MKRLAARDGKPVPYGESVLAVNLRSKIITHYALRITHYS